MYQKWRTVAQRVHSILKEYPHLRLTHGRKVLEVRPVIDWNKGKAVEFLLESLGQFSSTAWLCHTVCSHEYLSDTGNVFQG